MILPFYSTILSCHSILPFYNTILSYHFILPFIPYHSILPFYRPTILSAYHAFYPTILSYHFILPFCPTILSYHSILPFRLFYHFILPFYPTILSKICSKIACYYELTSRQLENNCKSKRQPCKRLVEYITWKGSQQEALRLVFTSPGHS
jgi:hypothetical protein